MDYRIKKGQDLIRGADNDWNYLVNNLKLSNFFEDDGLLDKETLYLKKNKLAEEIALVCEKYMKALYLKKAVIPKEILDDLQAKISKDSSRIGEEKIEEKDIVDLIISNNNERTNYLYRKLSKHQRSELSGINYRGISHEFTKIFDKESIENFNYVNDLFLQTILAYRGIDFKEVEKIENASNDAKDSLFKSEVKDAFERGRYAEITPFIPDITSLLAFTQSVQRTVAINYNGLTISEFSKDTYKIGTTYAKKNGATNTSGFIHFGNCMHIFPDINTDIKILGNNKKEEYSFGICSDGTLYKLASGKLVRKKEEELIKEVKEAPKFVGLFSKDNKMARYFKELNKANGKIGFLLDDGDIILYVSEGVNKCVSNRRGQIDGVSEKYANERSKEIIDNDINR